MANATISQICLPNGTTYDIAVSKATYNVLGTVKPWYSHTAASTGPTAGTNSTAVAVNAITTTASRYYAIEVDSNGRLFVNVPWTNVNSSYLTSSSTLDATKLSGTIPAACYTNTTYSSLAAASGGTAVSLVTTGEKYTWNQKLDSSSTLDCGTW